MNEMNYSTAKTMPMKVSDLGFLVDRYGEDCSPLQFLRELTQNSIEAIQGNTDGEGTIVWDLDWNLFDLDDQMKICITDTGQGMSGDEMVKYINHLSSSIHEQSLDGNYGIGAKIAAATRNHSGLIYQSWQSGVGNMIHLWRDPSTNQYGLRRFEQPDGSYGDYLTIDNDLKPDIINQHGTRVILLGMQEGSNTMEPPEGLGARTTWVAKYLNSRYFTFGSGIQVKVRQGWDQPRTNKDVNLLRTITGQKAYLEKHCLDSGIVPITNARVHWWILKDEKAIGSNSGHVESAGHVAILHKDELYELASSHNRTPKLLQFGILFGGRRIVLYIEPLSGPEYKVHSNSARTHIRINEEDSPWHEWGEDFSNNMPGQISDYMEQISANTSKDESKNVRDRLQKHLNLFKLKRFRPVSKGSVLIDEVIDNTGGLHGRRDGPRKLRPRKGKSKGPKSSGSAGKVYAAFAKEKGQPGTEVNPNLFPLVQWITAADGSREPGFLEDKAASYVVNENTLLINSDFRVFTDMINLWLKEYEHLDKSCHATIESTVRSWFEQTLVESIIGLQALTGSKEWTTDDLNNAWSETSLTSVVMPRVHPYIQIKRDLATKFGKAVIK